MCLPVCLMKLTEANSRRSFLRRIGMAVTATAPIRSPVKSGELTRQSLQRVFDLTHTLSENFPMTWPNSFSLEQVSKLGKDAWNANRWHLQEHSGTHLDAPLHCTHGPSGDRIPADQLVGPLVVVDIQARASTKPDSQLTLDDLKAWERQNGPIAAGAVVALYSGWDTRVDDARKFFGLDEKGGYHFPGFHLEAVQFLQEQRDIKGIATDTLSLDSGTSADFPVHHYWLGHNKWGLENVASLGSFRRRAQPSSWAVPRLPAAQAAPAAC